MIYLLPIGKISQTFFNKLGKDLKNRFDKDCQILEPLDLPGYVYTLDREQYQAGKILDRISELELPIGCKVLGICDVDLYSSGLNFVFGQAEMGDRDCVVSLFRLNPKFYGQKFNEQIFYSRILKEAVHELGHTFRLHHCPDAKCVMHFSNSLEDTDYKENEFCEKCKGKLNL